MICVFRKRFRIMLPFIFILCLSLLSGAAAESVSYSLPVDFSVGPKPDPAYRISGTEYLDPSLHVTVETGTYAGNTYWLARITVADASQLRTYAPRDFRSLSEYPALFLAKKANAVLAVNGDFIAYTENGFCLRQGKMIVNHPTGKQDLLLIDKKGDFYPLPMATADDIDAAMEQHDAVNILCFGPILAENGQPLYNRTYGDHYGADSEKQRMAIAQTGPLEYIVVCLGHHTRGSRGMTLWEFADFMASFDPIVAYNLDGGDSTALIFMGERVNDADCDYYRDISDIVYFATAVVPEE